MLGTHALDQCACLLYLLHETIRPVAVPMSLNFALKQQAYFVTVAPGHLAHQIQACISVRFANTIVVVGLSVPAGMSVTLASDPQLCLLYACTRPMGR